MGYIKFQEGGMSPEAPQAGGEDQLVQLVQQIVEMLGGEPEMIMAVAQMLMEAAQGGQEQAPAEPTEQAPAFKKGGKMNKNKKY